MSASTAAGRSPPWCATAATAAASPNPIACSFATQDLAWRLSLPHNFKISRWWLLGTRIDCEAAPQSIPVPNSDSGADYLLPHFMGSSVPAGRPHTELKNRMGRLCMGTSHSEHIRNR
jgi:hypothetical protein